MLPRYLSLTPFCVEQQAAKKAAAASFVHSFSDKPEILAAVLIEVKLIRKSSKKSNRSLTR